jgi:hypothetical protein
MRTIRYCRRCRGMTEYYEADPPRLPWSLVLLWPFVWLIGRIADPPACSAWLAMTRGDD